MLARYRLLRLAEAELTLAVAYYEREQEGLGLEFFERYETAALHAMRFPEAGAPIESKRLAQLGGAPPLS